MKDLKMNDTGGVVFKIAFVSILVFANSVFGKIQETELAQVDTILEINADVDLQEINLSNRNLVLANVGLVDIQTAKKYKLRLKLNNTTPREFSFDRTRSSCGCGKLTIENATIPQGESGELIVEFQTPQATPNGEFAFSVLCMNKNSDVGELRFNGKLGLNLSIAKQTVFEIGEKASELRIPFLATSPIEFSKLEVVASKSLGKVEFLLQDIDEKKSVRATVDPTIFKSSFHSGTITIRDKKTAVETSTELLIIRKRKITVTPTVLRPRKLREGELFRATILVQINETQELKNYKGSLGNLFRFVLNDEKLNSEEIELAPNIFKIHVHLDKKQLESFSTEKIRMDLKLGTINHSQFFTLERN